jgi:TolA-binding protein
MLPHEDFLELCASATAGELTAEEKARLDAHLAGCADCRQAMSEYEIVARSGVAALSGELATQEAPENGAWSTSGAKQALFNRLDQEDAAQSKAPVGPDPRNEAKKGQRFTYHPSEIRWREVWMPFAAAVLLALALGITAYRKGVKHGADVARTPAQPVKESVLSLEEQSSDAGYERTQLVAKLNENTRLIEDLKRQLAEQKKIVNDLRTASATSSQASPSVPPVPDGKRDDQLAAAQAKLLELQKTMDDETARRQEVATRASALEAKVDELTELVRDHEQALGQKQGEIAKQQELLDHDRDIRELMGARDLYIVEVHDVAGTGKTDKTYGRVFYTKGKSLIFYAYDLDSQPGLRNASTFQAWGRRGPDKEQALNLGIFYEDNASKKRWVLKAKDPKTLADIDAVFVTVEPNGGSHHPSGKQLLFAYLRVTPNHP